MWLLVIGSVTVFTVFTEGLAESAAWTAEMGRMFDLGLETDGEDWVWRKADLVEIMELLLLARAIVIGVLVFVWKVKNNFKF